MMDPRKRILFVLNFLFENTDECHTVTVPELVAHLNNCGFPVDRRAVYADIDLLRELGINIQKRRTRTHNYYLESRRFEMAELKLLVDAVQSCRFLTVTKSKQLIQKLETLASKYQAVQLSRQVFVQNRIKTDNERIYSNVDSIHEAIQKAEKISFQYCQYTIQKTLTARRNGAYYIVSPYLLTWADDNYYLIGDHPYHEGLSHYRVDKMMDVTVIGETRKPLGPLFDPVAYAKSMFSMYAGERRWMEIAFDHSLAGVVIDRFGTDVCLFPLNDSTFLIRALISVSPAFFGWMLQFGDKAKIISPAEDREHMVALMEQALKNYKRNP